MIARVFDGKPEGLSRDDVLDNITLYWLTNTAISSARLYWDTAHNLPPGGFFDVRGVKLPVAVSAFAEEIYQAPKSWAEKAYAKAHPLQQASPKAPTSPPGNSRSCSSVEMRASFQIAAIVRLKPFSGRSVTDWSESMTAYLFQPLGQLQELPRVIRRLSLRRRYGRCSPRAPGVGLPSPCFQ